jgi:hypothetical protein
MVELMTPKPRKGGMQRDMAETIALKALAFLAGDEVRLGRFMAITGIGVDELRKNAQSPRFLEAVLEHLLGDESLLLVFAAETGISPEDIDPARLVLAAGA